MSRSNRIHLFVVIRKAKKGSSVITFVKNIYVFLFEGRWVDGCGCGWVSLPYPPTLTHTHHPHPHPHPHTHTLKIHVQTTIYKLSKFSSHRERLYFTKLNGSTMFHSSTVTVLLCFSVRNLPESPGNSPRRIPFVSTFNPWYAQQSDSGGIRYLKTRSINAACKLAVTRTLRHSTHVVAFVMCIATRCNIVYGPIYQLVVKINISRSTSVDFSCQPRSENLHSKCS
jgi:hypothetical protein